MFYTINQGDIITAPVLVGTNLYSSPSYVSHTVEEKKSGEGSAKIMKINLSKTMAISPQCLNWKDSPGSVGGGRWLNLSQFHPPFFSAKFEGSENFSKKHLFSIPRKRTLQS